MNSLKQFLYGILIGISNLIPGFSGGTMALILGIYENFTKDIANLTKKPIESLKKLFPILFGIIVGLIGSTFIITICLEKFPFLTTSFFIGLVIASIPHIIKKINKSGFSISGLICMIFCIVVSILLPILKAKGIIIFNIDKPSIFTYLSIFLIAALAAAVMIIPAASGSMILLIFGLYYPIINKIKETLIFISQININGILNNLTILIPFFIGIVFGIVLIAKILTYLFNNHEAIIWYGIFGLLITSIFTIYFNTLELNKNNFMFIKDSLIVDIILNVMFIILGILILSILNHRKEKIK